MKNKKNPTADSRIFWKMSKEFISHRLPDIRKSSPHTIEAYRTGLNKFIDYLEMEKHINRADITFEDFNKSNVTDYLDWMINVRKYADKTCNLRITAIHSLLEYAAYEDSEKLIPIYLEACTVKALKVSAGPIEYFEGYQMKALLAAPDPKTRIGRRNQVMLILYYDTAARISELLEMKLDQLHLDAEVPYLTILGKGRKYRNIPLMDKTVRHLKKYLNEYHSGNRPDAPLFYTRTYGELHPLSHDTVEKMIKKYADECVKNGIKMPDRPHCHMIRKTRAMDLYKNKMPLTHIQQLLGHENISTTSGFYAFATLETLAVSMNAANKEVSSDGKKWNNKEILKNIYSLKKTIPKDFSMVVIESGSHAILRHS